MIGLSPVTYFAATAALVMGRIMSLVMFAAIGLNPISNSLASALIGLDAVLLLVIAGALMTPGTLAAAFNRAVRAGTFRN